MITSSIRWTEDQFEAIISLRNEGISISPLCRSLFDEWMIARDDLVSPTTRNLAVLRKVDRIYTELHKLETDEGYLTVMRAKGMVRNNASLLEEISGLYHLARAEDNTVMINRHDDHDVLLKYRDTELIIKPDYRDNEWTFDSWLVVQAARIRGRLEDEHHDRLATIGAKASAKTLDPHQAKRAKIIGERIEELRGELDSLMSIISI